MILNEILGNSLPKTECRTVLLDRDIDLIRTNCIQFLRESNNMPVYKCLPKHLTFMKLKARVKRGDVGSITQIFNETFSEYAQSIKQRCITAHGTLTPISEDVSRYYIFPIDGFSFLCNKTVVDTTVYEESLSNISDKGDIVRQILKDSYTNSNLSEAIESGAEMLFFNTPYCYAVNTSSIGSYHELINLLGK